MSCGFDNAIETRIKEEINHKFLARLYVSYFFLCISVKLLAIFHVVMHFVGYLQPVGNEQISVFYASFRCKSFHVYAAQNVPVLLADSDFVQASLYLKSAICVFRARYQQAADRINRRHRFLAHSII